MYICQSQSPNLSHPSLSRLGVHTFVFFVCVPVCICGLTHPVSVCFSLSHFMEDFTGCQSHGDRNGSHFRKNSSGRQWDLPIHPPSPVSVAALPQCITLKPKSPLRGSVYMTELSELHYGWSPSHLAFTCHVTIPSLLGLLPDAALGVWGCSAGFAENVICREFPSFRCYCFLLFGMDSRTRSEKIQWKPVLLIFKNISLLLFFPFPLL